MSPAPRPDGPARRASVATPLLLALLLMSAAYAATAFRGGASEGEAGGIAVREASLRHRPSAWLLDARADIDLSPAIRAGLDSGVPLEFVLELSLREPRRLLPDRTLLEATRRYELTYYELTRHYRVRSLDDGSGRNYRSLPAALAGLGTLRGVPLGIIGGGGRGRRDGRVGNGTGGGPAVGTARRGARAAARPSRPAAAAAVARRRDLAARGRSPPLALDAAPRRGPLVRVSSWARPSPRRTLTSALLMGLLFVVLIGSLYVLGTMALRLDRFGRYYHWLLVGNGVALAFIAVLLGMNGWRLVGEFRRQVAGARLTVKLVVVSVLLALVPVTLVYGFSVRFLRANINSYFDLEIERTLDDALELARASLDLQMRTLQRDTRQVADELVGVGDSAAVIALNTLTDDTEASEMTLIGPDNRIVASTGLLEDITMQPDRPDDDLIARARQGLSYVGVDPGEDGELYVRVVTPVLSSDAARGHSVLQALYPVARRSADLAMSVQSSYQQYRQLVFLRRPLMVSSLLTLSLALLLSVMMSVWFAFYAARRMMLPVHDLVEGTRAVAGGDYGTRIDRRGKNDELGFLVHSFNRMTLQLEQSRAHAEQSRRQVERQRARLQTVLGQISSGVITLEGGAPGEAGAGPRIRSANDAAVGILGEALADLEGEPLADVARLHGASVLAQFVEGIEAHLLAPGGAGGEPADWSLELPVVGESGRRFLFCRGAVLFDADGRTSGQVIVIDDMTAIIGAQRDAAWSEVARRLAHEIKNPLTPIQLSAERLRHKFARKLGREDVELLTRLTHTIENQVDALKSMVNAFADYASTPRLDLVDTDVNALVRELAELYEAGGGTLGGATEANRGVSIELELDESLPPIPLDTPRLRQLVHNLIKNALEAQQQQIRRVVRIVTRRVSQRGRSMLEIVTLDEGPGFAPELLERLFEPYVTSKPRGTGLGLAVVRKIVEEHDGTIRVENRPGRGACVTIALPCPSVLQLRESAA